MNHKRRQFLIAGTVLFSSGSRRLVASDGEIAQASHGPDALEKAIRWLMGDAGNAEVAVAFHDVATREELLIQAEVTHHAASTMKVPIMMEVFRELEDKTLSLDERIAVKNEFTSIADGGAFSLKVEDDSETTLYKRIGEKLTLRELVRLMITESSNIATNMVVERVTAARVTEFMRTLGAGDVHVLRGVEDNKAYARGLNNTTTARGLMLILQRLAERRVVSATASEQMLAILREQRFNEGIPAGLPAGMSVAHKTGAFGKVYHDAAIAEPRGRKPYVLVVLTRGFEQPTRAHKFVANISRTIYQHTTADRGAPPRVD
jgi:beta-lactamase class A